MGFIIVDFPTFDEISTRELSEHLRKKFYYTESDSEFVLYYADELWSFKTTVDIEDWVKMNRVGEETDEAVIQRFRDDYLERKAIRIIKYEKSVDISVK